MQNIQVGNGWCVAVLFIILVIIAMYGHKFEVFASVSEMYDNVDLVLGMKNVFELEGVIEAQDSSFKILNRLIPFFSKEQIVLISKVKEIHKDRSNICGWDFRTCYSKKMLDRKEQCTVVLKLKFIRNQVSLDITKNTKETVIFDPKQMLCILDLRSLCYLW